MKRYHVYIITNQSRGTLYVGVTNDLARRLAEHRAGSFESFSKQYRLARLVYSEECPNIYDAIAREKQLKNWHRQWKVNLIETLNPEWKEMSPRPRMGAETSSA